MLKPVSNTTRRPAVKEHQGQPKQVRRCLIPAMSGSLHKCNSGQVCLYAPSRSKGAEIVMCDPTACVVVCERHLGWRDFLTSGFVVTAGDPWGCGARALCYPGSGRTSIA